MALAGSGMMSMALAGLFLIEIYMFWIGSLESDYGNILVMNFHSFHEF